VHFYKILRYPHDSLGDIMEIVSRRRAEEEVEEDGMDDEEHSGLAPLLGSVVLPEAACNAVHALFLYSQLLYSCLVLCKYI
jgi:hypothetical protein